MTQRGGHFFKFEPDMWSSSQPLVCHESDCAMNVFTLLKMVSREKALSIARKSRGITNKTIISFLDRAFHTKHTIEEIYNESTNNLYAGIDHLLSFLPDGFAVIAGLIGKPSHLAVISNEGGSLYIYDPQIHEKIPMYSFEMVDYLEGFQSMHVFISYYESNINNVANLNSSQLKINAIWNKHNPRLKIKSTSRLSYSLKNKSKSKSKSRRSA